MNEITYTPGGSLNQLETATLSAPYKGWEKVFRLNVLAPYYLTAGLVGLLGAAAAKGDGRGCVIIFSSPASVHNNQFVPTYQTSKAAVDHLVRIMAAEFADFYSKSLSKLQSQTASDQPCSSCKRDIPRNSSFGHVYN
jgi:NAD(P)-dependent dehydrogenase (short-subunit alcohol dehydrogenase family)